MEFITKKRFSESNPNFTNIPKFVASNMRFTYVESLPETLALISTANDREK